jgi:hypothetical protein
LRRKDEASSCGTEKREGDGVGTKERPFDKREMIEGER